MDEGMPFNRVSGFPKLPEDEVGIRNPGELFPEKKLKLLFWGAPHPKLASDDDKIHGSKATGHLYKTEAFESMAWLCPMGVVAMTFGAKYCVEFYQPRYHHDAMNRVLLCGQMYAREYIPMASGSGLRFTVPDAIEDTHMVAFLIPPLQLGLLCWKEGQIDFGQTMLNILQTMAENEYGCALGVYDGSLEMELIKALENP